MADTPNQGGSNVGTPTFPTISCSNGPDGDMFMNYMDYVDDVAMFMFTAGQVTRMQAALDGVRSTIGTSISVRQAAAQGVPQGSAQGLPQGSTQGLPQGPPRTSPRPKDFPKDPPKDFPKDPPKDFPKDPPKDFPKDPPKDFPKDGPKDFGKDFPKELAKDPGMDPQKPFLDPPKSFLEPPIGLPVFPGGPLQPGGGMPFVLATPAAAGFGARGAAPQQGSPVAAAYLHLMGHYAGLHARGLLDAAGLAAWHQAAAAYQQLQHGGCSCCGGQQA